MQMAKYRFKNFSQATNYINKKIEKSLTSVSIIVMNKLKENVEKTVYSKPPLEYQRTNQVLNSISRTKPILSGGKYTVEIYFDPLKILPIINEHSWNAHASFSGEWAMSNSVSSDNLIGWLENGTPNNKYYQHPAYGFIKETVEWLRGEYLRIFKEELKKNGITT